jgi:hypothetical protein
MSILPEGKSTVTVVNPKSMVLFGSTKQGKTTLVANLEDNLIIDLEGGTRYYECLAIDVPGLAEAQEKTEWAILKEIVMDLKKYKKDNGTNKYKRITLDTAGVLESITMPYAIQLYKAEARNKNYQGKDLRQVANGAGWAYIREAFFNVLAMFELYCDNLIIVAHTKAKTINKGGQELEVTDIDVSGKMSQMLAAKTEAIGLVYRKENKTMVSFKGEQFIVSGARPKHLKEQEFVMCESDEDLNMTFYWDKIFK